MINMDSVGSKMFKNIDILIVKLNGLFVFRVIYLGQS